MSRKPDVNIHGVCWYRLIGNTIKLTEYRAFSPSFAEAVVAVAAVTAAVKCNWRTKRKCKYIDITRLNSMNFRRAHTQTHSFVITQKYYYNLASTFSKCTFHLALILLIYYVIRIRLFGRSPVIYFHSFGGSMAYQNLYGYIGCERNKPHSTEQHANNERDTDRKR